jgi:hypothetical protein
MDPYKAQLVTKVFTQREGIDFKETFNSIIKLNSIRTVLSIVAPEDMNITQFDVKTTFFYGAIEEEIYMVQPLGFEHPNH